MYILHRRNVPLQFGDSIANGDLSPYLTEVGAKVCKASCLPGGRSLSQSLERKI